MPKYNDGFVAYGGWGGVKVFYKITINQVSNDSAISHLL